MSSETNERVRAARRQAILQLPFSPPVRITMSAATAGASPLAVVLPCPLSV